MTDTKHGDQPLSAVLLELATETDMSMKAVRAAISRHPAFEADILGFALEWSAGNETAPSESETPLPAPDLSRLRRASSVTDPFHGQSPSELKGIATLCDIPFSILMKLCERLIDVATIPLCLIRDLAGRLSVDAADLLTYLEREQTLATADYRSAKPPEVGAKISFASAIRMTPMPDTQRDKWLELAE